MRIWSLQSKRCRRYRRNLSVLVSVFVLVLVVVVGFVWVALEAALAISSRRYPMANSFFTVYVIEKTYCIGVGSLSFAPESALVKCKSLAAESVKLNTWRFPVAPGRPEADWLNWWLNR